MGSSVFSQMDGQIFVLKASYISIFLFMSAIFLSCRFFRIIKRPSIHRFQLIYLNDSIAPMGLICLTNLKVIKLWKSVSDAVYLGCFLNWAVNESSFCPLFRINWTTEKLPSIIFLNVCCVLSI